MMRTLTFILILFATSSFSQTPNSQISNDSINTKLLDQLIADEINFERSSRNIYKLIVMESTMQKAKVHTLWMIKENKFEHSTENLSENIQINLFTNNLTYSELSKKIVLSWMNSPGHRAAILAKGYPKNLGVHVGVFKKETSTEKYICPAKTVTTTQYTIKITAVFE